VEVDGAVGGLGVEVGGDGAEAEGGRAGVGHGGDVWWVVVAVVSVCEDGELEKEGKKRRNG
jgi:hypothetical protein